MVFSAPFSIKMSDHNNNPNIDSGTLTVDAWAAATPSDAITAMGPTNKEMWNILCETNGHEAYDSTDVNSGTGFRPLKLILPTGFKPDEILAADVGAPMVVNTWHPLRLAQIYVLNKAACPVDTDAVKFGLIRMEAVKMGWFSKYSDVAYKDPPTTSECMTALRTDLLAEKANLAKYRTAAFVIPLAAEHTFRTMGHHFISSDAINYSDRYRMTLKASLCADLENLLSPAMLYHGVLHWVNPRRIREVVTVQLGTSRIPDAIKVRYNAAPAGTAIISITCEALASMKLGGIYDEMKESSGIPTDKVIELEQKIKANPTRYHKFYFVYGEAELTDREKAEFNEVKAQCELLAPIIQAYIDNFYRDGSLGKAKALIKHAKNNPVLYQNAKQTFRKYSKANAPSVAALFMNKTNFEAAKTNDRSGEEEGLA